MLAVKLDQFEWPLDLLLHLIEEEKLDITEVSLARVADEYLVRLSEFSEYRRLDELSDFIVIAAKLLLIKSRLLVPALSNEEEEDIEELQRQLKRYKVFYDAAKKIDALYRKKQIAFPRRAPLSHDIGFSPSQSLTSAVLCETFKKVLAHVVLLAEKPKEIIFIPRVSIKEKIDQIVALLSSRARSTFNDVIKGASSRADVVVSFMALLELVKQRSVVVSQSDLFHDIVISRPRAMGVSDQRGQTLLEVLGGFFVIAVGLVGVMSLATTNVRNDGIGLSRLIATNLAREGIEVARNMRDTNWLADAAWYTGLVDDAGKRCATIPSVGTPALSFLECPSGSSVFDPAFRLSTKEQTIAATNTLPYDEYVQDGGASSATEHPTAFYRTLTVDPVCLNDDKSAETMDGCIVDPDCLDPSKKDAKPACAKQLIGLRVTSEVSWKQSGSNHQTRLREMITNWR